MWTDDYVSLLLTMKMFDMIVDTISNNEIKKIFCNGMWLCE